MNVTSMLSNGYLQPSYNNAPRIFEEGRIPPDEEQKGDARLKKTVSEPGNERGEKKGNKEGISGDFSLSRDEQAIVRELKRIEMEVVAHEAAHQSAGGGLTGAASYSYTKGPDGRSYVTGGEVSISVPESDDPEQTLRNMEQVQRAALAPANPSGQDLKVAAGAAAKAAAARQELAAKNREASEEENAGFSPGISFVKAGLLFERLHGENQTDEGNVASATEKQQPDGAYPAEAYGRNASSRGLWTLRHGFEPIYEKRELPGFDIAA
ncbi:MAG: hypothetical protein FWG71_06035 [Synergistaceae bacterium]|nr:hypothetical protein [Synergistaceae bacterium]